MMLTLAGRCTSGQIHRIAGWVMSRAVPASA
jgi:hypothetical protein